MAQNGWLKDYSQRIEKLNYTLEESIQRGSFDTTMNLTEILSVLRGSVQEIKSLQTQVDVLKDQNKKLKESNV